MASDGVDLGSLSLASTASGRQLRISSRARIAPPEEGLESAHYELTGAAKPWYTKGNDFCLSIGLKLESECTDTDISALAQSVSQRLGESEQWRQLPLKPVSIQVSPNDTSEASVIVRLNHGDEVQTKRQQHKLEDGVPGYDRRPPPGVPVIALNEVHLTMSFSGTSHRKRRKLEPSHNDCNSPASDDGQEAMSHRNLGMNQIKRTDSSHYLPTPAPTPRKRDGPFRRSKTSPVREYPFTDEAEMLMDGDALRSTPPANTAHACVSSRKRSYSTGDLLGSANESLESKGLMPLFDAGLRLAITSNAGRSSSGIRIVSNESFKHLADAFSSLWAPGYLYAVSSRAVFLPTIDFALSNVCSRHARSSTLRAKVAELNRRNHVPGNLESKYNGSIASRLWMAMQSSLLDKKSACGLKAFSQPTGVLIDQDELVWPNVNITGDSPPEDGIDDLISDSDESMLDEELMTPEPGDDDMDLLWNDFDGSESQRFVHGMMGHVAEEKRGFHVGDMQDDEVLSLCESVGSIALSERMDVAIRRPEESMPFEDLADENLFASWGENAETEEEMMPI